MIGQVSLSVAYGIDTAPRDDPNIALAEAALQGITAAVTKGRIFNLVPFRKPISYGPVITVGDLELPGTVIHLPWWFPGAGFKKEAKTLKPKIERCRDGPYETVKKQLVRTLFHPYPWLGFFSRFDQSENKAVPSIAATMITELSEDSTEEATLMAKALPGTIYVGTIFHWIHRSLSYLFVYIVGIDSVGSYHLGSGCTVVDFHVFSSDVSRPPILHPCDGLVPGCTKACSRRDRLGFGP